MPQQFLDRPQVRAPFEEMRRQLPPVPPPDHVARPPVPARSAWPTPPAGFAAGSCCDPCLPCLGAPSGSRDPGPHPSPAAGPTPSAATPPHTAAAPPTRSVLRAHSAARRPPASPAPRAPPECASPSCAASLRRPDSPSDRREQVRRSMKTRRRYRQVIDDLRFLIFEMGSSRGMAGFASVACANPQDAV